MLAGIGGGEPDGPWGAELAVAQQLAGGGQARRWRHGSRARPGQPGDGRVGGQVGQAGQLAGGQQVTPVQRPGGQGAGGVAQPVAAQAVAAAVDRERRRQGVGAGPQPALAVGAVGAGDAIAHLHLPAGPGQLGQGGAGLGHPQRLPRARRSLGGAAPAGGEQVQQPPDHPGAGAGGTGQRPGGAAGPAQPPPGGRPGQDLGDRGLAAGQLPGGAQQGPERVDPVLGAQRLPGPPASRNAPPNTLVPASSDRGGVAAATLARAPGQAASTARSTRWGATVPGTHSPTVSPWVVQCSSKLTWGRGSNGRRWRSSPARLLHSASAAPGSTCGGARMPTSRAPAASRWWRHRRQPRAAATPTSPTGRATANSRRPQPAATPTSCPASSPRLPQGSSQPPLQRRQRRRAIGGGHHAGSAAEDAAASSAGSLVTSPCSAGEAWAQNAARWPPDPASSPSPTRAASSS